MAPTSFALLIGVATRTDSLPAGPDLTRYLFVCGGLIAMILLLAWGFRRLIGSASRRGLDRRGMRIVDMLPLGGKQRLAVVRCYDRTFVLGLGDKEIHVVGELDRETAPQGAQALGGRTDFSDVLSKLMGRSRPAAAPAADGGAQ
ncbi:MAG: hypothetical protein EPO68_12585 [Planctomycetota bacterium]|nr:MAG: hypothetical protein EPO68_12585 [Planctomycetota bacterium]